MQAHFFETEVGADLGELDPVIPEHLRPAFELAQELMANREDSEEPTTSLTTRTSDRGASAD